MKVFTVSTNDKSVKLFEIPRIMAYGVARANIFRSRSQVQRFRVQRLSVLVTNLNPSGNP